MDEVLESDPVLEKAINDFCVHGIPKGDHEIPILQIYLSKKYKGQSISIIDTINKAIVGKLPQKKQIAAYKIRTKKFPVTFAGKTDVESMKREKKGFIKISDHEPEISKREI